jgi:hypothetical protein
MLRRNSKGKYVFKMKTGKKCTPSAAAAKRHVKLFGGSGNRAHRKHFKMNYKRRVENVARARLARGAKADFMRARRMPKM